MDNLKAIFMAEAAELIADIERALLQLEQDQQNKEGIQSIFRAMHTLKGSASMFGFDTVSTLTHHLESIYESIRDGKNQLSTTILSTTFKGLDHLQKLIDDPTMENEGVQQNHALLLKEIINLEQEQHQDIAKNGVALLTVPVSVEEVTTYYIYFLPPSTIAHNGTNALYLVEDLLNLGDAVAIPFFNNLPSFEELAPDASYIGFELVLSTSKTEKDIRDVFMFVAGECELTIVKIAAGNVLADQAVQTKLLGEQNLDAPKGVEKIKDILTASAPALAQSSQATGKAAQAVSSIRVSSERLDELMNLVSELVTTQARLSLFAGQETSNEVATIAENVEKITRRLRDNAFSMCLIPVENLVVRFSRLVRDLSTELKKDISFKTEGTDTEIDKSVIEKLTDPILHLLRNCIDHGIELPAERRKKGKPAQGTILLKSFYSGANVIIQIIDDGAGIDLGKVKKKAISRGLIAEGAELSEKELLDLIFLPGFSTADQLTGVSGRGVGMDVVKRNIADIRGEIELNTKAGEGTTFTIKLPLTLSIIDGLLVRIKETDFIIPLVVVDKCYEVETTLLTQAFNQWVTLDGERIPFLFLRNEFSIYENPPVLSQVIKVAYEGRVIGLVVDRIIGQYQAVLKPLGQLYHNQNECSGATILGDGSVALVLDTAKLIKKLFSEIKPIEYEPAN